MTGTQRSRKPGHHCRRCPYFEPNPIVERQNDWLYRCPQCGAYDWTPEPERVPEGTAVRQGEARGPR